MVELNSIIIHTLYWSSTKYSAKMSVWLKHCITAFIKHVLPWFCKPTTPGTRSGGHACRFSGGTRPFVVVVLAVVCLAYGKYWSIKKEREKMKWFFFFWKRKFKLQTLFTKIIFPMFIIFWVSFFKRSFVIFPPYVHAIPLKYAVNWYRLAEHRSDSKIFIICNCWALMHFYWPLFRQKSTNNAKQVKWQQRKKRAHPLRPMRKSSTACDCDALRFVEKMLPKSGKCKHNIPCNFHRKSINWWGFLVVCCCCYCCCIQ